MNTVKIIALVLVVAVVLSGVCAYAITSGGSSDDGPDDGAGGGSGSAAVGEVPGIDYVPSSSGGASDWMYWLGNVGNLGVSDAKTPIDESDMTELWSVSGTSTGMFWTLPGTPISVGEHTYYYNMDDRRLYKVVTHTGEVVASTYCYSSIMYNTPVAYGDGKVFVPLYIDGSTVMYAFDADTLEVLFHTEPVYGGEVQGAITYYDGYVFFGTYYGDYACFSSEDTDTSRGDEAVSPVWIIESNGWYNSIPAFFGDYCIIVDKGYDTDPLGATVYSVEYATGAIACTLSYSETMEYCVSSAVAYDGRVYIATGATTDIGSAAGTSEDAKTVKIHSYEVSADGVILEGTEMLWASDYTSTSGTQSIPVIYNDRIYIAGGGSVMGSGGQPFTVIQINPDGSMETAYVLEELGSKGSAALTTAYATEENGYSVYIYIVEYGRTLPGEASDSSNGEAYLYCLRDSQGQTEAEVVFTLMPSIPQFSYLSVTISPDGHILVRNDGSIFCYGFPDGDGYSAEDLVAAIDRLIADSEAGRVNPVDVARAEERYEALSEADRALVTNYRDLQDLYVTVTFVYGDSVQEVSVVSGSTVSAPLFETDDGEAIVGWEADGAEWVLFRDRATSDTTLTAVTAATVTVTFDTVTSTGTRTVVSGHSPGYVTDPTRDGYSFGGWTVDGEGFDPRTDVVTSDTTVTAVWLVRSTISFDPDGGSEADPIEATYSWAVGELPTTTRSGYTFAGWYLGDVLFTSETVFMYEEDVTLTARWVANPETTLSSGSFTITGLFTEGSSLSVYKQSTAITSSSLTAICELSGLSPDEVDLFNMRVYSDGLSSDDVYTLGLDLGQAYEGEEMTVYLASGSSAVALSGTVQDGFLYVEVTGQVYTSFMEITVGIQAGTGLVAS